MNEDDFIYGCRSGIQKAVRRGNLDLAKTCFDALWSKKEQRSWLKWRIPVIVAEEAWFMAGELGRFLEAKPTSEKDWRRFIYRLTLVTKNQDASALAPMAKLDEIEHRELEIMGEWMAKSEDPVTIVEDLVEWCYEHRALHVYEKSGVEAMKMRMRQGGMLGDRFICMGAIILIFHRVLTEDTIQDLYKEGMARYKKISKSTKPSTINLPWYVFDMHTQTGKMALNIFMKHKAKKLRVDDKRVLSKIWFYKESSFVPPDLHKLADIDKYVAPHFYEQVWWDRWVKIDLEEDLPLRSVDKLWSKAQPEMGDIVRWCLDKRDK